VRNTVPAIWRQKLLELIESNAFTRSVIALILINAAILGLETFPTVMERHGGLLKLMDRAILGVFIIELTLRIIAHGKRFLRDPWSMFDTAVVAIALVPASDAFSVLRAMRVLRVLRLISAFPQLRRVLQGFVTALPGLGSITAILGIFMYVFAVMAAKLFGQQYPQWFGGLFESIFTLFQVMTLEGWADIVREIEKTHAYAGVFFVVFILVSTFTVLNLLIAVVVDAMPRSGSIIPDGATDAKSVDEKLDELSDRLNLLIASNRSLSNTLKLERIARHRGTYR
jgi:voltage-gated sodium channel